MLAKLDRIERILNTLVYGHIASHYGDGFDFYSRIVHGHNQRDRIIGGSVGIYNEVAHHIFSLVNNMLVKRELNSPQLATAR